MEHTLVLNADFRPIEIVDWQKAICYVFAGKADVIVEADRLIRSVSLQMQQPLVIRLKRYCRYIFACKGMQYNRVNLFFRDDMLCQYCSKKLTKATATIDHVIPRCKGGQDSWENTVAACMDCNQKKGNRSLSQAGMLTKNPLKRLTLKDYLAKKGFSWWGF